MDWTTLVEWMPALIGGIGGIVALGFARVVVQGLGPSRKWRRSRARRSSLTRARFPAA